MQEPIIKELLIENKMGIHARPAAMFVKVASQFNADIFVEKDGERINGKSIMGLMMLAAGKGSKLTFHLEGEQDQASNLMAKLDALFQRRFDEA